MATVLHITHMYVLVEPVLYLNAHVSHVHPFESESEFFSVL